MSNIFDIYIYIFMYQIYVIIYILLYIYIYIYIYICQKTKQYCHWDGKEILLDVILYSTQVSKCQKFKKINMTFFQI